MGINLRYRGRPAHEVSGWMKGLLASAAVLLALFGAATLTAGGRANGTAYAATPEPCSTQVPQVAAQQLGHEPTVSVTPNLGPSGSSATLHAYNFLPNQDLTAIFRVIGDPVVATGKTDANGEASLRFTVPTAPDGSYYILVAQANRTCVHASVRFQIGPVPATATPRPTNTPTPAASATAPAPTATTTAPAPTATATATPRAILPTPVLPKTGTGGSGGGGPQVNLFLALIALGLTASGFGILGIAGAKRRS